MRRQPLRTFYGIFDVKRGVDGRPYSARKRRPTMRGAASGEGIDVLVSVKTDHDAERSLPSELGTATLLLSPFRARTAHVVQFGPVRVEQSGPEPAPPSGSYVEAVARHAGAVRRRRDVRRSGPASARRSRHRRWSVPSPRNCRRGNCQGSVRDHRRPGTAESDGPSSSPVYSQQPKSAALDPRDGNLAVVESHEICRAPRTSAALPSEASQSPATIAR